MLNKKEQRTDYYFSKKLFENDITLGGITSMVFALAGILTPSIIASVTCIIIAIYWAILVLIMFLTTDRKLKAEHERLFK